MDSNIEQTSATEEELQAKQHAQIRQSIAVFSKSLQNTIAEAETTGTPLQEIYIQLQFWSTVTMKNLIEMSQVPAAGQTVN